MCCGGGTPHARQIPDGALLETDLAIIGAGAAGITLARALADAPFRTCLIESGGLERPVSVRFDPAGEALYVVDFGVILHDEDGAHPQENTGVLWRITRGEQR